MVDNLAVGAFVHDGGPAILSGCSLVIGQAASGRPFLFCSGEFILFWNARSLLGASGPQLSII